MITHLLSHIFSSWLAWSAFAHTSLWIERKRSVFAHTYLWIEKKRREYLLVVKKEEDIVEVVGVGVFNCYLMNLVFSWRVIKDWKFRCVYCLCL